MTIEPPGIEALLGAFGQVAFDVAGLPWLQAAAAVTAIAVAAAIDRAFSRRRMPTTL